MKKYCLLILIAFAAGCTKDINDKEDKELPGAWRLVGYSGGIAQIPFQKTEGSGIAYEFSSGNYTYTSPGYKETGVYKTQTDVNGMKTVITKNTGGRVTEYAFSIVSDTLRLYQLNQPDATTDYYARNH